MLASPVLQRGEIVRKIQTSPVGTAPVLYQGMASAMPQKVPWNYRGLSP